MNCNGCAVCLDLIGFCDEVMKGCAGRSTDRLDSGFVNAAVIFNVMIAVDGRAIVASVDTGNAPMLTAMECSILIAEGSRT